MNSYEFWECNDEILIRYERAYCYPTYAHCEYN